MIAVVNDTDKGCIVVAGVKLFCSDFFSYIFFSALPAMSNHRMFLGDIFECANDGEQWREVSRYPEQQEKSRSEILSLADWIVPGHGPMFKNEKSRSS